MNGSRVRWFYGSRMWRAKSTWLVPLLAPPARLTGHRHDEPFFSALHAPHAALAFLTGRFHGELVLNLNLNPIRCQLASLPQRPGFITPVLPKQASLPMKNGQAFSNSLVDSGLNRSSQAAAFELKKSLWAACIVFKAIYVIGINVREEFDT